MRALSLWQPWASAIALGLKRIETRHWSTSYRGPLAIHAAKRWTADEREFLEDEQELGNFPPGNVPLGAVVAVARLADIRRTEDLIGSISRQEEGWGNYGPRRYGWILEDIVALPAPIPFKGAQGLFDVPDELIRNGAPPLPPPPPPPLPPCPCYRCTAAEAEANPLPPEKLILGSIDPRLAVMFLCETCGNKRCPHAADHRNACTGSNAPGQPGSLYEAAA